MRLPAFLFAAFALWGCRVLESGLAASGGAQGQRDAAGDTVETLVAALDGAPSVPDVGESPGVPGPGCSDGTREGFRSPAYWPDIAGCAGGFEQTGVIGALDPACNLQAGDTSVNPLGRNCSAADLCAQHWHVCRDGSDVAKHSPTGCESCVPPGELRFFLVASGASSFGVCSPDPNEANDLHGCGGLGQPESDGCPPLTRRMGFADCLATRGVWSCGGDRENLEEAALVTKTDTTLGGVLCCRD